MTTTLQPELEDRRPLAERLRGAIANAGFKLKKPGAGTTKKDAEKQIREFDRLGLLTVGFKSSEEEVQEFCDRLWYDQDDILEPVHREWFQSLLYCAGEQLIAYHRERRTFIPRRLLPWRVRSVYNFTNKAVNLRVSRLTENKPMVSVQAQTADKDDIEKAEYKETLFWYLWERLALHLKISATRRWAAKCGSGFLKVGWDPDAGCEYARTEKRAKYRPAVDPMTGQPAIGPDGAPVQEFDGIEEFYVSEAGEELGPVELEEPDPITGEPRKTKAPVPEDVDYLNDGEATVTVRAPFNVRFDRYAQDITESWYIQDADIVPLSRIIAWHPDALDKLQEAKPAGDEEKALRWTGQTSRVGSTELPGSQSRAQNARPDQAQGKLDVEYLYLETWIFPKNRAVRKLWGDLGARIVTVGGIEIARTALPKWAVKACPFVQLIDQLEEGNNYGRPFTRDIIPLQDDVNRSRSMRAERQGILSRLILWAPANHGINVRALGDMSAALITTRTREHKPEALKLDTGDPGIREFEVDSLNAAADLGNMNEASTGKLPSAGLAAKAIYALQYADERTVSEASTLQDIALKRLAEALDAVTREEYQEARKVRLVGEDRAFMVEHEISPETIRADVDYTFTPGSMMSRQKESVKNEMFQFLEAGLVDAATVKKHISAAVPDVFRSSYNLQEAKARRQLQKILRSTLPVAIEPAPFDDPTIHCAVLEEFALTSKWDLIGGGKQAQVMQLWQAYKLFGSMPQPMGGAPDPAAGAGMGAGTPAPPAAGMPDGGAAGAPPPLEGAAELEATASEEMQPPDDMMG